MATKEECDRYAAELNRRFEEFTSWAIENWPKKDFPLLDSDFAASRRELADIIGPKLGDGDNQAELHGGGLDKNTPQYVDVSPMPWP